jgi:hypothetical protein
MRTARPAGNKEFMGLLLVARHKTPPEFEKVDPPLPPDHLPDALDPIFLATSSSFSPVVGWP